MHTKMCTRRDPREISSFQCARMHALSRALASSAFEPEDDTKMRVRVTTRNNALTVIS